MALGTTLPYGLRDIKLVQYPSLDALAFGNTLVDLPNARTMSFNDTEDYDQLRGDDKLVTSHGQGSSVEWELESGGYSFAAHAIVAGGVVVDTGITPNQKRRYRKKTNDQRPFFVGLGQAISDSGGDFHAILYLCRATGDVEAELADTEFVTPGISGTGFPCRVSGNVAGLEILDTLYDFVQNETITNLTAPALDTPGAPIVYSLDDVTGPAAGGEIVNIAGEKFIGVTGITVGGTNVTDYQINSPFSATIVMPAKTAGSYNVVVTNASGSSATGAQTAYVYF